MDMDTSPLKRCSSAPIIPNATTVPRIGNTTSSSSGCPNEERSSGPGLLRTQRSEDATMAAQISTGPMSSDTPPAPNIFSRTRRYSSGSFSPLATAASGASSACPSQNPQQLLHHPLHGSPSPAAGPRLTPRVSQLRKEECADISNTREVSHERGLHNQLQISQSWEDLTIVTENWSCRDDCSSSNSLLNCSSPSPTSSRHQQLAQLPLAASSCAALSALGSGGTGAIRYPFGMSPSPTRKTFATRRSMSPNHVRPSQLCPVKRKFDMDDSCGGGSPPPHKKMFLDVVTRGSSPIHSLPMCASPDSGTYEGRTTPKLFISKLCSSNSLSSFSSASASPTSQLEGMHEGGGGGGEKGAQTSNTNSNSSSVTASETSAVGDAKEVAEEEGEEGQRERRHPEQDQPMVDVSSEAPGKCDRQMEGVDEDAKGTDDKSEREIKDKADVVMGGDTCNETEVDDGIGEEVPGLCDVSAKKSESVPVT